MRHCSIQHSIGFLKFSAGTSVTLFEVLMNFIIAGALRSTRARLKRFRAETALPDAFIRRHCPIQSLTTRYTIIRRKKEQRRRHPSIRLAGLQLLPLSLPMQLRPNNRIRQLTCLNKRGNHLRCRRFHPPLRFRILQWFHKRFEIFRRFQKRHPAELFRRRLTCSSRPYMK